MPFIKQEIRNALAMGASPETSGDLCYIEYKEMVDTWRVTPRWTTAHNIYKRLLRDRNIDADLQTARELAWQVFFQLYVMPYELLKREENGDI